MHAKRNKGGRLTLELHVRKPYTRYHCHHLRSVDALPPPKGPESASWYGQGASRQASHQGAVRPATRPQGPERSLGPLTTMASGPSGCPQTDLFCLRAQLTSVVEGRGSRLTQAKRVAPTRLWNVSLPGATVHRPPLPGNRPRGSVVPSTTGGLQPSSSPGSPCPLPATCPHCSCLLPSRMRQDREPAVPLELGPAPVDPEGPMGPYGSVAGGRWGPAWCGF